MCVQRSLVVMQGTSLPGVSLTRLSHPAFDCALAVAGRQNTAAAQSAGSHHCLTRCGMSDPPEQVETGPCGCPSQLASTHQTRACSREGLTDGRCGHATSRWRTTSNRLSSLTALI